MSPPPDAGALDIATPSPLPPLRSAVSPSPIPPPSCHRRWPHALLATVAALRPFPIRVLASPSPAAATSLLVALPPSPTPAPVRPAAAARRIRTFAP
uniref:Uncharacterized protein n=1 Tax=Triticum aestivum TaxID=4565 RepID=D0QEK2_WHEAT|nr:unknown protein [Triticum aestivum]